MTTKPDIYEQVTDRIIGELEAGRLPWVQPWDSATAGGMPENASTGNSYSGVNILLLWLAGIEGGYTCPRWVTFKQALALGGAVQKGEKGTTVVYADRFVPKKEQERAEQTGEAPQSIGFLKRYTVFNVAQCKDLPADLYIGADPLPERELIPRAEALIAATGADFRIGGPKAFYAPGEDFIQVPPQQAFGDQVNYYRTSLHELSHWTGHTSRLDRNIKNAFGSKDYAREELVAEMSAAFTCARLGIQPTVRHADYIGSWLEVLREDKRAIFKAASMATKAADYLLAFEEALSERLAA